MKTRFDSSYRELGERARAEEERQRRILRCRLLLWLLPSPFWFLMVMLDLGGWVGLRELVPEVLMVMLALAALGFIDSLLKTDSNRPSQTVEHPWEPVGTVATFVLVQFMILASLVSARELIHVSTEPERPPGEKAPMM